MSDSAHFQEDRTTLRETNCILFHCARYSAITPIITMGLWGLADHLTSHGFNTKIVHTGIEEQYHNGFNVVDHIHKDLLIAGCSAHWFPMTAESLDLLKEAKEAYPSIFTVMGGYTGSFFAREIMASYPWIDGIVQGDGEKPLLELITRVKNRDSDLRDVPNLVWRSGQQVVENEFSYVSTPEDIEHIEYANYSKYLHNYDFGKEYYFQISGIPADFSSSDLPVAAPFYLLAGKGCPNNCSICGGGRDAQKMINNRSKCMFLGSEHVVRTVKQAMEHGYRNIYVCHDPSPKKPRYFEYLKAIREENLDVGLGFGFWQLPTREIVQEFKKTSRNLLFDISPESISENVRKVTKDAFYYSNEELYKAINMLYDEQVYCHVYFAYFLPTETIDDLDATRKAFWKINVNYPHYIEAIYIKISTDPASPLYVNPEAYNTKLLVNNLQEHLEKGRQVTHSNVMVHAINTVSPEEQERFQRKIGLDGTIKHIFKYHIKCFARAFPSIQDFVEFLDGFYEANKFLDDQRLLELDSVKVLTVLKQYAEEYLKTHTAVPSYLVDIIEYVRHFYATLGREAELTSWDWGNANAVKSSIIALSGHTAIAELKHDVFKASNYLLGQKQFCDIERRDNWLLFTKGQDGIEIFEVNDSLYELLIRCKDNVTKKGGEILNGVIDLYTDDGPVGKQIESDMLLAIEQLAQAGILKVVES